MAGSPSSPNNPIVIVSMTDLDVIERVAALWDRKIQVGRRQIAHHKQPWYVRLQGSPAAKMMHELRPYMSKRRQAQIDSALNGFVARPRQPARCGTTHMYKKGCRCEACCQAKRQEYIRLNIAA